MRRAMEGLIATTLIAVALGLIIWLR